MKRVPNLSGLRIALRTNELVQDVDTFHPLHEEPLLDLRNYDYFWDAHSYFSRPNSMVGAAVPGVSSTPLVRRDIAERLAMAEEWLRTDYWVRRMLGAPAHLRIRDALRSLQVQRFAFNVAWPQSIGTTNPELTNEEVGKLVPNYSARPDKVTAHMTGGVVDVALVNLKTGEPFDRGHKSGAINGTAYPDFHERYHLVSGQSDIADLSQEAVAPPDSEVVLGRRILFYAMSEVAGLYPHPRELWHWGRGDALSEFVSGSNNPYYGAAQPPA